MKDWQKVLLTLAFIAACVTPMLRWGGWWMWLALPAFAACSYGHRLGDRKIREAGKR
jgi:hypothetical protein